ncbi:MAG TPA: response regulator transcription factor [Clostridia bacterium]
MEEKILIVDDEKGIVNAIAFAFRKEGYIVETANNGQEALDKLSRFSPHVMILDVMMPKMSGLEVCKKLVNEKDLGIILLTAKDDIVDKILGLELGADDYITKPFDMRELIARVKSIIRRLEKSSDGVQLQKIEAGDLVIIPKQRKVILCGEELEMPPKEFDLLVLLMSNPARVYERDELLNLVWGLDYVGGTRTVDIHVQRLRSKLGERYHHLIQTVYGVGYKALGD